MAFRAISESVCVCVCVCVRVCHLVARCVDGFELSDALARRRELGLEPAVGLARFLELGNELVLLSHQLVDACIVGAGAAVRLLMLLLRRLWLLLVRQ